MEPPCPGVCDTSLSSPSAHLSATTPLSPSPHLLLYKMLKFSSLPKLSRQFLSCPQLLFICQGIQILHTAETLMPTPKHLQLVAAHGCPRGTSRAQCSSQPVCLLIDQHQRPPSARPRNLDADPKTALLTPTITGSGLCHLTNALESPTPPSALLVPTTTISHQWSSTSSLTPTSLKWK